MVETDVFGQLSLYIDTTILETNAICDPITGESNSKLVRLETRTTLEISKIFDHPFFVSEISESSHLKVFSVRN